MDIEMLQYNNTWLAAKRLLGRPSLVLHSDSGLACIQCVR